MSPRRASQHIHVKRSKLATFVRGHCFSHQIASYQFSGNMIATPNCLILPTRIHSDPCFCVFCSLLFSSFFSGNSRDSTVWLNKHNSQGRFIKCEVETQLCLARSLVGQAGCHYFSATECIVCNGQLHKPQPLKIKGYPCWTS